MSQKICFCILLSVILFIVSLQAGKTISAEPTAISLAGGKLEITPPANWKKVVPSVRIIEYEFKVPAAEGDKHDARVTIMGAGGSVDANVKRWLSQFTKTIKSETTTKKIAEQQVHLIDIAGTYNDRPGPFAPGVQREGYRMLAAIIVTDKAGQYFVKFYGPEKTVGENEKAFRAMIDHLQVK